MGDPNSSRDDCTCGCGYRNGVGPGLAAQLLTFAAAWFSLAAVGDCAFAAINDNPILEGLVATHVGFVTFQKPDGYCYMYDQFTGIVSEEDQIQLYWDFLGSTWKKVGVLAYVSCIVSWCFFFYATSFCCSSHVKPLRYFFGFLLSIVLVVMQGCTFIVYGSTFCDENGCTFSRSAGFCVGAILCQFFAGLALFVMSDYPGRVHPHEATGAASQPVVQEADVPKEADVPPGADIPQEADVPAVAEEAPLDEGEAVAKPY